MADERGTIDDYLQASRALRERNIAHREFGTLGFHAAEAAKNDASDYLIDLLERAAAVRNSLDAVTIDDGIAAIQAAGENLHVVAKEIDRITPSQVHDAGFPLLQAELIERCESAAIDCRRRTATFASQVESAHLRLRLNAVDAHLTTLAATSESLSRRVETLQPILEADVPSLIEHAKRAADGARAAEADATQIVANLRDAASTATLHQAVTGFGSLSVHHAEREEAWLAAFATAGFITMLTVLYAVFGTWSHATLEQLITSVVQRTLLISLPALFVRVALTRFNLERHLRIIYSHRQTALEQYRLFESAVGDDASAKQQLRLEIARHIFSDPATGYGVTTDRDTNVSPVVNILERVVAPSRDAG